MTATWFRHTARNGDTTEVTFPTFQAMQIAARRQYGVDVRLADSGGTGGMVNLSDRYQWGPVVTRDIHVRVSYRASFGIATEDQNFLGTTAEFADAFGLAAGHEPQRPNGRVTDGEVTIEWADQAA